MEAPITVVVQAQDPLSREGIRAQLMECREIRLLEPGGPPDVEVVVGDDIKVEGPNATSFTPPGPAPPADRWLQAPRARSTSPSPARWVAPLPARRQLWW
jgi:hypothetical protein